MKHTCERLRVWRELVNISLLWLPGSRSKNSIRSNNARFLVSVWTYMTVALQIYNVVCVYLFTFM